MITDAIHHILSERRREINATRVRKQFEDLVECADAALLELDADESAANERKLTAALDAIKAHVLARLVENGGDASALPLESTLADGRTVREVCADEIAAVREVPKRTEDFAAAARYVAGDRARIEEAKTLHIKPLEDTLAADIAAVTDAKNKAAEAEKRLAALKKKHNVG